MLNLIRYYQNLPRDRKRLFYPIVLPLKIFYKNWREIRFNIYILSGKGKGIETNIRMLCITSAKKTPCFIARVYETAPTQVFIKRAFIWNLKRIISEYSSNIDLTLIDTHRLFRHFVKVKNSFLIPHFVKLILDINKPMEEVSKMFSRNVKGDLRITRKFNYSYDTFSDLKSLKFFYEKMYVPYIKERYPERAEILELDELKGIIKKGMLIFVKSEGKYICGSLCENRKKHFFFHQLGILDGNEDFLRKRALTALYYFTIIKAKEENAKVLDFDTTGPFLSDGLLRHKIKWGARVCRDRTKDRLLTLIVNRHKNVAPIFTAQPFICIENGTLKAVIFVSGDTEADNFDIKSFNDQFATPGITALKIIDSEKQTEYINKHMQSMMVSA